MSEKGKDAITAQRKAIVDKVIADMKAGGLEWTKPWDSFFQQRNAITGNAYRGGNRFHLAFVASARGLSDPRWCTFKQAKDKGWHVKKGAKGAKIEKWRECTSCKTVEDASGEESVLRIKFPKLMGAWNVFNAEDIDGIPELEQGKEFDHVEDRATLLLEDVIKSSRCKIREFDAAESACYHPLLDYIDIPSRRLFGTDEAFLAVLLHEMTHSTGHASALGRLEGSTDRFGSKGYAFEELIAELGSLFVAGDIGLNCQETGGEHYERHVAYLESWIHALDNDPDFLFKAAAKAEAAATYLKDRYKAQVSTKDIEVA